MKCSISFARCGALIGIFSWLGVCAAESILENDQAFHECAGIYLKRKGIVEYDIPSVKKFTESECMLTIQDHKRSHRNVLENLVKRELPNETEATCVLEGFDEIEYTEFTVQVFFVSTNSSLSLSEKVGTTNTMAEGKNDSIKSFVRKCGIDEDRLKSFMSHF